jgi:hypothetical protein
MGILNPDLTIISGWTLRGDTPVRTATVKALSGLKTKTALLIDFGLPLSAAEEALQSIDYSFEKLLTISSAERAAIFSEICGADIPEGDQNSRPSNGLFAVALVLWAGASNVIMTGFSLSGGHAYMGCDTPREHVAGDRWFLHKTQGQPISIL